MGHEARNLATWRQIVLGPMYSAAFECDSCEVHIWWIGGAMSDLLNQHQPRLKDTEISSWLITIEQLQAGSAYYGMVGDLSPNKAHP
jgi:hypothetical protein